MSTKLSCDVLIVGGGPAGLSVASALPTHVSSIIVHQDADIGLPVRTSGASFLNDVQALGLPPDLYKVMTSVEVYSDTAQAHFDITLNPPVILQVTQTYQYLKSLSDAKNRKLFLGAKFIDAERQSDGRYTSQIRSRNHELDDVTSRYIIDASGVQFAVLRALGHAMRPTRTGVGVEYEYPVGTTEADRAVLFVGSAVPSGYGWAFPTPDGTLRLGIGVIHPDTDASPRDLMARFLTGTGPERMGLDLSGAYQVNAGSLPSEPYDPRLVHGHVIRVGDTANFATPTAGEGIRIAIEYGRQLGTALGQALAGDTAALLRYEAACGQGLARNYRYGFLVNRRIARYTAKDWDASARRLARLSEAEFIALLRSEFSIRTIANVIWKNMLYKVLRRKI